MAVEQPRTTEQREADLKAAEEAAQAAEDEAQTNLDSGGHAVDHAGASPKKGAPKEDTAAKTAAKS